MNSQDQARVKRAQKRIAQGLQMIREAAAEVAEIVSSQAAPPRAVSLGLSADQTTRKTA